MGVLVAVAVFGVIMGQHPCPLVEVTRNDETKLPANRRRH